MRLLPRASFALAFALLTATGTASAQLPSIDARTWRPSTDPRAQLVLEPTTSPALWQWNVGAWLGYAYRPLSLRDPASGVRVRPVEHELAAHLTASLGIGGRAAIGVALPMALYQAGDGALAPTIAGAPTVPNTAIGDLTLHAKGALIANEQGGFGLAALGALSVPTGERTSFFGEGAVTASARFVADYNLLIGGVQASLGYKLRTSDRTWPDASVGGVTFGAEIPWSLGIRLRPAVFRKIVDIDSGDRQTWEIAAHGTLPGGPVLPFGGGDPGSSALSPVLLALSDRVEIGHFRDAFVLAGVDIGLSTAVGTPTIRGVLGLGWAPREHDVDHDSVADDVDQCPDIPEDRDGFEDSDGCPDIDDDEDGITDEEDACPRVKGDASPNPKTNGCVLAGSSATPSESAADRDGDGVPDTADTCADQGEDKDGFEDADGCPDPDDDADGIADGSDACPRVAGDASPDPARNGCPATDRDGDTIEGATDKCPDAPEAWNGVDDDDGCPDTGGKPLVVIDTTRVNPTVKLAKPLAFTGGEEAPALAPASLATLRALGIELRAHPEWTLAVGARPASARGAAQANALARAFAVVTELSRFAVRDGAAETVSWDVVRAQAGSESGVGLLVLVTPTAARPGATP